MNRGLVISPAATWPRGGSRYHGFFLAFPVFLALGLVLPLVVTWRFGADAPGGFGPALAWVIILYAALRLSQLSARGEMRLLSLTFWAFVYVWLGMAPLAQLLNGSFPYAGVYDERAIVTAFAIIILGLVAFECAQLRRRTRVRSGDRQGWWETRTLDSTRILVFAAAAVLLASIIILSLGGVGTFLVSRSDLFRDIERVAGAEFRERSAALFVLLRLPTFLGMFLLWWLWLRRRGSLGAYARVALWAFLAACTAINVVVSNPVNSPRYWFGTVVLAMAFVSLRFHGRWWFAASATSLIGMLLLVFPYADLFRRQTVLEIAQHDPLTLLAEKGDYDAFQQLLNAVVFVDEEGMQYGRQIFGALFVWIPRRIWPSKPIASGSTVAEQMGYDYTNLSMPLWGEAYLDGGALFVVVVMALYGYMVAMLESSYLRRPHGQRAVLRVFVPVLAAYQILLLRGALMSALRDLVVMVFLIVLVTRSTGQREVT